VPHSRLVLRAAGESDPGGTAVGRSVEPHQESRILDRQPRPGRICDVARASCTYAPASGTGRRKHLTTATTMYREMDMRFWLEQVAEEMRTLA
jgi:hypothetical protein